MVAENQGAETVGPRFSNPVFVVGVFRSGTSLLYALLNQHPRMALMYECDVWDFPETFSKVRFKHNWMRRQEFLNQALSRHRLIFGNSLRGLESTRTPEDLYRTYGEMKGGTLFGEKSPFYSARLRRLARRYPGCSFVLLWRNPIEIYRSVVRAGRREAFFRRWGIFARLIRYQEQMIQQTAELERAGARLCHVTYDGLMEDTGKTCRNICQFLGIDYDERMLDLANADLSAVYPGPEHDHLRSGRVERRQCNGEAELIKPHVLTSLQRFDLRWRRLQTRWLGERADSSLQREPSLAERCYYSMAGSFFCTLDDGKRLLFEFLPLTWLRRYRQLKKWFLIQHPVVRQSLPEQFSTHGITILTSYAFLTFVVTLDHFTGPDVTMAPFYMVPAAVLTLIIGRGWGMVAAVTAVICWSAIQSVEINGSLELGIVVWNSFMRFLVFLTVVLLLDRVRVEAASTGKADFHKK